MVLALAAFALNYGEFWVVAQLYPTNPLAKSVALLKQLPEILERVDTLKPRFEALSNLIKAMLDLTKCIVDFKELPSDYITPDTAEMIAVTAHIPTAVYWIIRSIVACAGQIMGLVGMGHEYVVTFFFLFLFFWLVMVNRIIIPYYWYIICILVHNKSQISWLISGM